MNPNSKRQPSLIRRTTRNGLLCTLVTSILLWSGGQSGWAWSYLFGAMLSLFSLISLTVLVPRLLHPSAPQSATFFLSLLMFLKLPFYALALYLATRIPGFSPAAIIAGAVQVPMLFAADALRTIRNEARPAIVAPEPTADLKRATQSVKAVHSELTGERG